MEYKTILTRAVKGGLSPKKILVFCEFFNRRFPNESDNILYYVDEWVQRFREGEPTRYMDAISKQVYSDVMLHVNEVL